MSTQENTWGERGAALNELLCFSIYSAGHAFKQFYRPLLDRLGLTYPQYLVLMALWAEDDRTVKGLGGALYLESNTLTPMLKRLEGLGHIARSRDPGDERQVRVRLTEQGRGLRVEAAHLASCVQEALGLPENDLARIKAEVSTVRDRLLEHGRKSNAEAG